MRLNSTGKRLLIIGLAVWPGACGIAHAESRDALANEIHGLVSAPQLGKMRVGVRIMSLRTDRKVVYERHSDEPFKPASNQKLITAAAAMTVLGPDFKYRTILARRGEDLVIIGSGDPSIGDPQIARSANEPVTAVFRRWADQLKARDITSIRGDLLFDDFIFDQEYVPGSWREQHNLEKWYAAPVGGLNFNDNCVDVLIRPAEVKGHPAHVKLVPDTPWAQLENRTESAAKGEPLVRRRGTSPMTISVSGPVSRPNDAKHPLWVSVTDPGAFFASTCRTVLASRGIKIAGETRRQRVRLRDATLPGDLKILADHETRPIDILWRVNKSSQNLFAEALLKTMGASARRGSETRVGSYETGRAAIRDFLKGIGVSLEACVIDDGCGLSHSNRTTPAVLTAILCHMDRHPRRGEWRSSLAVPGEEIGTLRRRMTLLKGSVFAKTGYIRGVSTLSGYVLGPGQRGYAFSILCNDVDKAEGGTSAARRLQDSICRTLATWEPEPAKDGG